MTHTQARAIAIAAIEAQIRTIQIDADLCDVWSAPPHRENFRTPRRLAASAKRKELRAAIMTLQDVEQERIAL